MMRPRQFFLAVAVLMLGGCPDEVGGPFATFGTGGDSGGGAGDSTTSGGDSADETHGFTPDPNECLPKVCANAADCCEGVQPNLPSACPSNSYPNNWSCVSTACVNAGCADDQDCVLPDLSCLPVAGVNACVAVCTDDLDCTGLEDVDGDDLAHGLQATTCSGMVDGSSTQFCLQPLP